MKSGGTYNGAQGLQGSGRFAPLFVPFQKGDQLCCSMIPTFWWKDSLKEINVQPDLVHVYSEASPRSKAGGGLWDKN